MFHLLLVHNRNQVELAKVLVEKAAHHRHILLGHWSQTRSLWGLKGNEKVKTEMKEELS